MAAEELDAQAFDEMFGGHATEAQLGVEMEVLVERVNQGLKAVIDYAGAGATHMSEDYLTALRDGTATLLEMMQGAWRQDPSDGNLATAIRLMELNLGLVQDTLEYLGKASAMADEVQRLGDIE